MPRKGGPGITQSDLLVINKTDLAEAVGADLEVRDERLRAHSGRRVLSTNPRKSFGKHSDFTPVVFFFLPVESSKHARRRRDTIQQLSRALTVFYFS